MFSELCRETLRKAAVCYSSSRSSASPSPSPPSSPPPSPSRLPLPKEVIVAAVETRDVGCNSRGLLAYYDQQHQNTTHFSRRTSTGPPQEFRDVYRRKRPATPTNVSSRRTSGLESRDGRRLPYAASVDSYSPPKDNHRPHSYHRRVRSASPEMLRCVLRDNRSDSDSSGDEAGAAPDDNQRSTSAHNRHSLRENTMHWFAQIGSDDPAHASDLRRHSVSSQFDEDSLDGDHPYDHEGRDPNNTSGSQSAREVDRVKLVRDRQNEERQRKLEELRQQALAAQRYREQREEERRRRIEELRCRDNDRRSQVEERKRQLYEADRERREALIRKNNERLARIEAKKKNERSQIVFAFGSSTPRMLEPADTGGMSSSFWGTRRATSTSNVMTMSAAAPLTRRSSERELDAGSKKRATSAGGLDRKPGEGMTMSSSMYEVFNWNDNTSADPPQITPGNKNKRASLSLPHTTDIFSPSSVLEDVVDYDTPRRNLFQRGASGDESEMSIAGTPAAGCVTRYANRRRTDLMPTIPSPRDRSSGDASTLMTSSMMSGRSSSAKSFTRSPGRTYSMSRLDQLARPRSRGRTTPPSQQSAGSSSHHRQDYLQLTASSMSRSMSHLAPALGASPRGLAPSPLKRTDNSRSMGTLPGSGPHAVAMLVVPRATRAERLRRKAREHHHQQQHHQQLSGARSGDVTPSSPSRPPSSMSQQSATSSVASSTVNLRPRTAGTPRRPRPASIAGTGVTGNYTLDSKTKDSKPPLPKSHSTTKTPPIKLSKPERPATAGSRSARASPRVTPKATPLQSPAVEMPPMHIDVKEPTKPHKLEEKKDDHKTSQIIQETPAPQPTQNETKKEENVIIEPEPVPVQEVKIPVQEIEQNPVPQITELQSEKKQSSPEPEIKSADISDFDAECDMSASMIQKIRITTEEEAKAALAERRRLAREQAEREAELERQRLEEEARLEVERQRAEEEEQRRLEEETLRLAEEARAAEDARLQQAIEEAKRREEEDRKRREEEAKQKAEKEEAERKAREEAEKQRLEMVERLKKEEEDRIARRKRVEAIMSRTRAKNQPNTPNKGEGNDGEKSKEESPSDESKPSPGDKSTQDLMTTSLISEATQQFISGEQLSSNLNDSDVSPVLNGTHANGINSDSSSSTTKPLLDNSNQDNGQLQELNGHHNNTSHGNGLDTQTIALDNATVKQNNATNNLLDLSEFDTLSNSNNGSILLMQPSGVVTNEDSLNSNLNPSAIPFMPNFNIPNTGSVNPFHDAFTSNKQQDNQVTDLLS